MMKPRKVMISGATRGIGKSIALRLIKEGHHLSLGVRGLDKCNEMIANLNEDEKQRVYLHKYNAEHKSTAESWVKYSVDKLKGVDTIIICAGIFKDTPLIFSESVENEISKLLQVNLMGPWYLMRAGWSEIIKSNNSRIIVISSMSGKRSKGKLAGYTVSKFALMGLCETVRNEGWEYGLRITALCPGWVNTDMANDVLNISKKDMTQPEDIGEICASLLKLPNSSVPFEIKINCNLEK
ncbi:SDR family NAD(P)-dependent oxidoreductase [Prochlorococcus sp. MIT 1341]|uniref:SDR family NAD(P)-dependent oxidoreductase n=1 Tax=Prochlorococcus sp. MIT 1341 TaxID=3096221 RepID=UPI002A75B218|nr:SDR family NAD(P)-dependent oxidoreductase [Prochlorococcus sp. MIT 1341]